MRSIALVIASVAVLIAPATDAARSHERARESSGLGLMVRPQTSVVSRCPTQAPSSLGSRGFSPGKAQIA